MRYGRGGIRPDFTSAHAAIRLPIASPRLRPAFSDHSEKFTAARAFVTSPSIIPEITGILAYQGHAVVFEWQSLQPF
jgi:hypothetical protein